MKKKCYIGIFIILFANNVMFASDVAQAMNGVEWLENMFASVEVTSTNLSIKFKDRERPLSLYQSDMLMKHIQGFQKYSTRLSSEFVENDEAFVLTLDKETSINVVGDGHGGTRLTPVIFKNQQTGFKIIKSHYPPRGDTVIQYAYVALGDDTLTEMSEGDVEAMLVREEPMEDEDAPGRAKYYAIWKRGENEYFLSRGGWRLAGTGQIVEGNPLIVEPIEEKPIPIAEDKTLFVAPESPDPVIAHRAKQRCWCYIAIPLTLCICGIVYFKRRKKQKQSV